MTINDFISLLKGFIDVLLVWLVIYYCLKSLRKNVKMILLFKGILIIFILSIIGNLLDLTTIKFLLNYVVTWGPLALIIIFQPEIRSVLEQLGRSQLLGRHKVLTADEREKVVYEVVQAVDYLKQYLETKNVSINKNEFEQMKKSLLKFIKNSNSKYAKKLDSKIDDALTEIGL